MIPAPPDAPTPFAHLALRRIMSGATERAAFHFDARSDGRCMFSVSRDGWLEAGSARDLPEAQRVVARIIQCRAPNPIDQKDARA